MLGLDFRYWSVSSSFCLRRLFLLDKRKKSISVKKTKNELNEWTGVTKNSCPESVTLRRGKTQPREQRAPRGPVRQGWEEGTAELRTGWLCKLAPMQQKTSFF